MQEEIYSLDIMEGGGIYSWNIGEGLPEHLKAGTAVQSFIDEPNYSNINFQEHSPEHHGTSERKIEGYRNPISDSATVSSKKNPSASPPNQRHQTEEIPVFPIASKRKSAKNLISKTTSNYVIEEVGKREKSTKLSQKKKSRKYESIAKTKTVKGHFNSGRWTRLEHFKFLEALKMFGKEWQKVQQHVYTRTSTQARSHAQKFFVKLDKKQLTLEEFLERLDIEQLKTDLRLGDLGDSTEYDEDQPLITIINQRNKGSVMNIALPGEVFKVPAQEPQPEIPAQVSSQENVQMSDIQEEEIGNVLWGTKRSTKQRKAKTNHAFFSKKYSESVRESVKRRKTDVDEEVILQSDSDTKIRINHYAIENYQEEPEPAHNIEEGDVQQFERVMEANSELDDILDNPADLIKDFEDREYNYYQSSVLSHHHNESIEDIINQTPQQDGFKGFNMMPNESQLESQIQFISNNHDWKVESMNFSESKLLKTVDRMKLDNDEMNLGMEALPPVSLIDQL